MSTNDGGYGTIRKTTDGYETRYERIFGKPPAVVWDMLTDPAKVASWYVRMTIEPRVDGKVVEHHDHVGMTGTGRVLRYRPPSLLEYTWWGEDVGNVIRWELTPHGSGCRLVLRMRMPAPDAGAAAGWHIVLDTLEDILEGVPAGTSAPPRGTFADGVFTVTEPGRGRWLEREALEARYKATIAALVG